ARIIQFRLPKDGDYYILASRNDLAQGTTEGAFNLSLTVGAISLESGSVTATLRWSGIADLNLFVRDPLGRSISWSDPSSPSGGVLQIDSNTGCQTPSAEPVEHIYFPGSEPLAGDYEIWVWYQDGCGREDPVTFSLAINVAGEEVLQTSGELRPRQRFETGMRVTAEGESGITNTGRVTTPTAQQEASEGGDIFIRYGESITGTISDEQYALFYQFDGTAGDEVMIRAERLTADLDPIVVLRDADNRNLPNGMNDDADPTTRNSLLTYTLPETGEYIIAVTRFGVREGTTTGNFRLTLERLNGE
ncbi:MAG TPA: PPC domain-containing protein, partial [Oceanobacillus sp.]|nr:PPC domain-containing protein [Oceanobacillus sp.]